MGWELTFVIGSNVPQQAIHKIQHTLHQALPQIESRDGGIMKVGTVRRVG
jgi:hypothetical protein